MSTFSLFKDLYTIVETNIKNRGFILYKLAEETFRQHVFLNSDLDIEVL